MSKESQLLKNTAIITIGRVCTQMISFFLLPLYTAVFSTSEFGIVDLFNTVVAFLLPILTLQIEQGLFRFLIDARDSNENKKKLISSSFIFVFATIIGYFLIFLIAKQFITNEYKWFLLLNVIANMGSVLMLQVARGLGNNKAYSIGSFIVAAFTVILNVLFIVIFKFGVKGMFLATFIANSCASMYLFIDVKVYRYFSFKIFDKKLFNALVKYSVALVPNAISWWVINVSDRLIISSLLSVGANGIYAAANKFSGMYINAYNIFNTAWTESAAVHINDKDKDEYFSNIINTGFKFFASFALIIIAITPFIFKYIINEKFSEAFNQIPLLILSSLFNVGVGLVGAIYVAKKKTLDISKTSFLAAIINIVVNLLLINRIGIYAASISTIIAYLTMFIYRLIDSRKYVNLKLDKSIYFLLSVVFILIFVMYYMKNIILNIIMLVFVLIFTILINKNSFRSIIKIIKSKKEQI